MKNHGLYEKTCCSCCRRELLNGPVTFVFAPSPSPVACGVIRKLPEASCCHQHSRDVIVTLAYASNEVF